MYMKKIFIFCMAMVLSGGYLFSQSVDIPTFVNTGKMYIGGDPSTGTALYVPNSVTTWDVGSTVSQIILNGRWDVGGSFLHQSKSTAFVVDANGKTTSTGTFRIVDKVTSNGRIIGSTYDRDESYIAFPHVVIRTNDNINVMSNVGMDAKSVIRESGTGTLLLVSNVDGGKVMNASLRITDAGTSSSLVTLGAVVPMLNVEPYRVDGGSGTQLFGYASPFKNTQKSGYFAGNWVRMPQQETNQHTEYILGNKPKTSNPSVIDYDQYVIHPDTTLKTGRAYLIKPRPSSFTYEDLMSDGGLSHTSYGTDPGDIDNLYDKGTFVFNGTVYSLTPYSEQLFADDNLPSYKLTQATGAMTTNWLMGNSYTCAISVDAIADIMYNHDLTFSPLMYTFPAGSTSYQPTDLRGGTYITLLDATDIPAMSIFMLRLSKNQSSTTPFAIGKDALVHSATAHNMNPNLAPAKMNAPAKTLLNNQVIFTVTPASNENVFDVAAIGIRETAKLASDGYDVTKVYTPDKAGFQLYTLSEPDANTGMPSKLSINGVPESVETVAMNLKTEAYESQTMALSVRGIETLSSEDFWVEDLFTGAKHSFINGEPYVFTTEPNDAQERFIVHFRAPQGETSTGDNVLGSKLNMYAVDKQIFIENLLASDMGANAAIYDVAGKLLDSFKITEYPNMSYLTNGLVSGTYIMRLYRTNSVEALKLIIR